MLSQLLSATDNAEAQCLSAWEKALVQAEWMPWQIAAHQYEQNLGPIGRELSENLNGIRARGGNVQELKFDAALPLLEWALETFKLKEKRFWFRYADTPKELFNESQLPKLEDGIADFRAKLIQLIAGKNPTYLQVNEVMIEFVYLNEIFNKAQTSSPWAPAQGAFKEWQVLKEHGLLTIVNPENLIPAPHFNMKEINLYLRAGVILLPTLDHFGLKAFYEWDATVFGYGVFQASKNEVHGKIQGSVRSFIHDIAHFKRVAAEQIGTHPIGGAIEYDVVQIETNGLVQEVQMANMRYRELRSTLENKIGADIKNKNILVMLWFHVFHEYVITMRLNSLSEAEFIRACKEIATHVNTHTYTFENFQRYYLELGLEKPNREQVVSDIEGFLKALNRTRHFNLWNLFR